MAVLGDIEGVGLVVGGGGRVGGVCVDLELGTDEGCFEGLIV